MASGWWHVGGDRRLVSNGLADIEEAIIVQMVCIKTAQNALNKNTLERRPKAFEIGNRKTPRITKITSAAIATPTPLRGDFCRLESSMPEDKSAERSEEKGRGEGRMSAGSFPIYAYK